ncbi:MAG TPA: hypothetical protein DEQ61_24485 [Streptomyces sp.]|nr:hypothetical protein [Streptomyces sp.]
MACSSSLIPLHTASQSLFAYSVDMALSGGVLQGPGEDRIPRTRRAPSSPRTAMSGLSTPPTRARSSPTACERVRFRRDERARGAGAGPARARALPEPTGVRAPGAGGTLRAGPGGGIGRSSAAIDKAPVR